jgi:hypothetical protein
MKKFGGKEVERDQMILFNKNRFDASDILDFLPRTTTKILLANDELVRPFLPFLAHRNSPHHKEE